MFILQNDLDELTEFYSSLTANELVETSPRVGLPCVVRYLEDELFYRSRIIAMDHQTATVLFVDFGNEQPGTPLSDLKRIIPRFLQIPQLVCLFLLWCYFKAIFFMFCSAVSLLGLEVYVERSEGQFCSSG